MPASASGEVQEVRQRMQRTGESYATARRNLSLAKVAGDANGPVRCPDGECLRVDEVLGGDSMWQRTTCWYCHETICLDCGRYRVADVDDLCAACEQAIADEYPTFGDLADELVVTDYRLPSQLREDWWLYAWPRGQKSDAWADEFSGKWLVFVSPTQVDEAWAQVRDATVAGRLGPEAKVATARTSPRQRSARERVICVYTADYRDHDEVGRVLAELRRLGFGWRLSYKADQATISGQYGTGSAIYVSPPGSRTFEDRRSVTDEV